MLVNERPEKGHKGEPPASKLKKMHHVFRELLKITKTTCSSENNRRQTHKWPRDNCSERPDISSISNTTYTKLSVIKKLQLNLSFNMKTLVLFLIVLSIAACLCTALPVDKPSIESVVVLRETRSPRPDDKKKSKGKFGVDVYEED
uniref:Transmembrane protein n=1 Tax=Timema monikensis TaxID=170555 RepID=A0A7R9HVU5_9NEOP|nr:unnamed protein product [Timema monikensis]